MFSRVARASPSRWARALKQKTPTRAVQVRMYSDEPQYQRDSGDKIAEYLKDKQIDEEGNFIRDDSYTAEDFDRSQYAKHMKKLDAEKIDLIDRKLKLLSQKSGVPFEKLRQQLDDKVTAMEKRAASQNAAELAEIEYFRRMFLSVKGEGINILAELVTNFLTLGENSAAFRHLQELDPELADAIQDLAVRKQTNWEKTDVEKLYKLIAEGSLPSLTREQRHKLVGLLQTKAEVPEISAVEAAAEAAASEAEAAASEAETETKADLDELAKDPRKLVSALIDEFSEHAQATDSPLFKLIAEIDPEFGELLKTVAEPTAEAIKETVAADAEAIKETVAADAEAVKETVAEPTAEAIEETVATDAEAVKETVAADTEAVEKLVESFQKEGSALRAVLEDATDDKRALIHKLLNSRKLDLLDITNAVSSVPQIQDSFVFQVVERIDPAFARLVETKADEINEYLGEGKTLIEKAMNDPSSDGYAALQEAIAQDTGITVEAQNHAVDEAEKVAKAVTEEVAEIDLPYLGKTLRAIRDEDQSKHAPKVAQMNEAYDMATEAMQEMIDELKSGANSFPEPNTPDQVSSLLGFGPTDKQFEEAAKLKEKPMPKYTDDTLELCVNIIMKDGKKDAARKYLNRALYLLYLQTRSDPVTYLKEALDMAAPIVVTKTIKTGFAKNVTVPAPLTARQRNRMAFKWILDSSDSRASNDFSVRLCEEIRNVHSGNSKLLEKRALSHKQAIANRSYLKI